MVSSKSSWIVLDLPFPPSPPEAAPRSILDSTVDLWSYDWAFARVFNTEVTRRLSDCNLFTVNSMCMCKCKWVTTLADISLSFPPVDPVVFAANSHWRQAGAPVTKPKCNAKYTSFSRHPLQHNFKKIKLQLQKNQQNYLKIIFKKNLTGTYLRFTAFRR